MRAAARLERLPQSLGEALDALAGQVTEQVRLAAADKPPAAPVVPPSADAQLAELQATFGRPY